jgi:microsomal epoxide hydrolase
MGQTSSGDVHHMAEWTNQLQQDRPKQTDAFVRSMYRRPQPEDYLKRVIDASLQVPDDIAVVLIYNMIAVKDFSAGFARIHRPVLFAYQPQTQDVADLLKSKLGDNVRLERFDGDGHALFVDDPDKFNRVLEKFIIGLPK